MDNVMRHTYRKLNAKEIKQVNELKDLALTFYQLIDSIGDSRELSLALTKVEEAVMWATKHITR